MAKAKKQEVINTGYIKDREIVEEMQNSYIDYAMSVIIARAIPDVRDGLKPVQRRILYAMHEDGLRHNAKFRKSANVIGSVLGRYHPHGDASVYDAMVRMAQDFSFRYPLVDGQGNFGCFTKDTKVRLCDGKSLSFEQLIKERKKGKKHWTFAFNHQTKEVEIAEIKKPRLTRKNEEIIEVTLDNGEKIKSTLDHLFMLRDGKYRKAKDLKPNDSLMPLYVDLYDGEDKNLKGYETVYQPFKKKQELVHHLADKWNLQNKIYEKSSGRIRHHKDFNKLNNNPDNILRANACIPKSERAVQYFGNFDRLVEEARKYNHKVIKTKILKKREDVYDLTIDSWHNFALAAGIFVHNSIDSDPPAAYRYTEARMARIGEEMLKDIDKETVNLVDNYDGSQKEPTVLPAPLPNLLLNGTLGIAVGMATSIPPHNLAEIVDATVHLIKNPKASTEELFQFVQGPDFPTGGQAYNKKEIISVYCQGKGPITVRGKVDIIDSEKSKQRQIVITEIPYQVNKAAMVEQFAKLFSEKKIEGIKDIRDESDREGLRVVIDLKNEAQPKKIVNRLYKFTNLQKTFHLNMLALVDGIQPKTLSLSEVLIHYINHRKEVVYKRTEFNLKKAEERAHILRGLVKALTNIDKCIKIIKASKNKDDARVNLTKEFKLTQIQANAILEMRLHQLAKLERKKIEDELAEKEKEIKELTAILKSPKKIEGIIEKELVSVKETFKDERRTKVYSQKLEEIAEEDLIPLEEAVITITKGGYIKRINPVNYKIQKRGGKGILGMKTMQDDLVEHFAEAKTHDSLLFFTNSGKVFRIPAYEIPEGSRVARGRGIYNFLEISSQEKILSVLSLSKEDAENGIKYLTMATEKGIVKRTSLEEFRNIRRSGLIAINLKKNDSLNRVCKTTGDDHISLVTYKGQSIRFKEKDVREMGRTASGIRGIRLKKDDRVVGMDVLRKNNENSYLLVLTENGYGKKTLIKEYRPQQRGGSGVKTLKVTSKVGNLAVARILEGNEEELIVVSQKGNIIKSETAKIPKLSRATQGVKVMRLAEGDKIASAICI